MTYCSPSFLPCVSSKIGALLQRVRLSITDWICQGKIVFSLGKMQGLLLGRRCHHENALPALISLLREVVINPARFLVSNGIMFFPFPPQWWTNLQCSLHPCFSHGSVTAKNLHDSTAQFLTFRVTYRELSFGGSLIIQLFEQCFSNT